MDDIDLHAPAEDFSPYSSDDNDYFGDFFGDLGMIQETATLKYLCYEDDTTHRTIFDFAEFAVPINPRELLMVGIYAPRPGISMVYTHPHCRYIVLPDYLTIVGETASAFCSWVARALIFMETTRGVVWKVRFGRLDQLRYQVIDEMGWDSILEEGCCITDANFLTRIQWRIDHMRRFLLRPLMRVRRRLLLARIVARRWVNRLYNPATSIGYRRCMRDFEALNKLVVAM